MIDIIFDIIKPVSNLEYQLIKDEQVIDGLLWGKPRNGHPEGEVIYHVSDVLKNVDKYYKDDSDYYKLRVIAIVHDTFKYKVDRTKTRSGENHHAKIARNFSEKYIDDKGVLDVIELHDEVYNIWQTIFRRNSVDKGSKRLNLFNERMKDNMDLFIKFYKCDSSLDSKKSDDYDWFLNTIEYDKSK